MKSHRRTRPRRLKLFNPTWVTQAAIERERYQREREQRRKKPGAAK